MRNARQFIMPAVLGLLVLIALTINKIDDRIAKWYSEGGQLNEGSDLPASTAPASSTARQSPETRDQAIAAIIKLGGDIGVGEDMPDKPVLGVTLENTNAAAEGLTHVRGFHQLLGLYLMDSNANDDARKSQMSRALKKAMTMALEQFQARVIPGPEILAVHIDGFVVGESHVLGAIGVKKDPSRTPSTIFVPSRDLLTPTASAVCPRVFLYLRVETSAPRATPIIRAASSGSFFRAV